MYRTRFAPSPTGFMHLGNIYSAVLCKQWAREHQAKFLLRIEDIDFTRCKDKFSEQIIDDLSWMGITLDEEVKYQSQRRRLYQQALDTLIHLNVLYPCACTRKQIKENTNVFSPSKLDDYPQTCLTLSLKEKYSLVDMKSTFSWRLNSEKVEALLGHDLYWLDDQKQKHHFSPTVEIGDVIIGRKDIHYSYHLAVVVDDAKQNISHVIRGEDLRDSTPVHRVLQLLLGYDSPLYQHHDLLLDHEGLRMAKTKHSITLKSLRERGLSTQDVNEYLKV
ncbi:MAG: tRNA glutamyl-Q(34) synthetase GluQRS [Ghiorsea sp.]